jgi:ubiquinone/menaquinone biosynthesis C-methylase UbiE
MPDVYAIIADVDHATQERLAEVLELRAADPQHRAIVDSYLTRLDLPSPARVLEVGCGTGAVTRVVADRPGVAAVVGVDPSPVFIDKAVQLANGLDNVSFEVGDGRALRFADQDFDAVVIHTTLCHVPQPGLVLGEVARVLRPGGVSAVCEVDYSTVTVALSESDPLQTCMEALKSAFIHDVWLARRLPKLLRTAGLDVLSAGSHGYLQVSEPDYMLTLVDRGADTLAAGPGEGSGLADALKAEARRRAEAGEFFGFMGFVSFIAGKRA